MSKWVKTSLVVVGAVGLTTLAINASDFARGLSGNLTGLAIESGGPCGIHETLMQFGEVNLCVDTYEASAGASCEVSVPQNEIDTQANLESADCRVQTAPEMSPWRFISLTQAQQVCARSGKRLPTSEEWYKIVSGHTNIDACNVHGNNASKQTGSSNCVTPAGIHDMIGNVWEWVEGEVVDGVYDGTVLPESGYVSLVNADGMVLETSDRAVAEFGKDYAITNNSGTSGIIRGGFYGSGEDAGIFAINASVPLNFRATGVGFRCVKDI